jgi:hypothetical protein
MLFSNNEAICKLTLTILVLFFTDATAHFVRMELTTSVALGVLDAGSDR